jgi:phage-related minor tail protein
MAGKNAAVRIGLLADASQARKEIQTLPTATADAVKQTDGAFAKLKGVFGGVAKDAADAGEQSASGFSDKLKGGLLAVGVGAGAALSGSLLGALDVQDATATLSAQLGLTGAASAKVGKVAGDLYKNAYGESVAETGDTIKAAFQNGLVSINDSEKAISDVGATVLNYSKLTGEDALTSTRAVAQMLKTKMAPNAKAAFDILTRGQELGINKSEDLLDTFNEYSTQFRKIGIDGTQALGLLQQGLQGGARDSDLVADALKEFSIRAVDGSKTSADAFAGLGLSAAQMTATFAKGGPGAAKGLDTVLDKLRSVKDPAKQAAIATGLFGTQAEDLGQALFKLDPSSATKGLGQVAGAADRAGKTLGDTAKSKITQFVRTVKLGLVDFLGNKVVPTLTTKVLPAVLAFVQGMQDGTGPGGQLANVLKTLASVVTPLVGLLGKLAGFVLQNKDFFAPFAAVIGTVVAAVKTWAAVQLVLNLVLTANPIGLLVLAIAALVAGVIYAVKNADKLKSQLLGVWNAIKGGVSAAVSAVISAVKSVGSVFAGFGQGIASAFSATLQFFADLPGKIGGAIGDAASWLFDKGKDVLIGFVTGYLGVWKTVLTFYFGIGPAILKAIGEVAKLLYTKGRQIIIGLATGYGSYIGNIARTFSQLPGTILKWIGNTASTLYTKGRQLIIGLATGYASFVGNVATTLRGLPGKVLEWIGDTASTLYTKGRQLIIGLITGYGSFIGNVATTLRELPGKVLSWIGNTASTLYEAGKDLLRGMINGVSSMAQGLINSVTKPVSDAIGKAKSLLGIHSPSTVFREIGRNTGRGMVDGLLGMRSQVADAAGELAKAAVKGASAETISPAVALSASVAGGKGSASAPAPVINVYAMTSGPEVGKQVVQAITDYERTNGARWRS